MSSGRDRHIEQRPALLTEMLKAARSQPALYQPGPYWQPRTDVAITQIRRYGLDAFRGEHLGIGTSYADNLYTDARSTLDTRKGRPVKFMLERLWPFASIFDSQVALTRGYARDEIALRAAQMSESDVARDLVARYEINDSLLGGCVAAARIDGHECSLHHVRTVHLIDRVRRHVDLESIRVAFEIGGGFGALIQLLLDNFSNIRKVVYLDVVPNLYVGTCYLRTLFGPAVRDFSETSPLSRISFQNNDSLEILAIAPWQIERLDTSVDLFWNSNSFVEMPREVVTNYAQHLRSLGRQDAGAIVLATYGGGGPDTLPPAELPKFFPGRRFVSDQYHALDHPTGYRCDPQRDAHWDIYLAASPGAHAAP